MYLSWSEVIVNTGNALDNPQQATEWIRMEKEKKEKKKKRKRKNLVQRQASRKQGLSHPTWKIHQDWRYFGRPIIGKESAVLIMSLPLWSIIAFIWLPPICLQRKHYGSDH